MFAKSMTYIIILKNEETFEDGTYEITLMSFLL